jgi:hypothetical protein
MRENQPQPPEESLEQLLERKKGIIEQLLKDMDFPERPEDRELREQIVNASGTIQKEILMRWLTIMEERCKTENEESEAWRKAQMGLIIAKATIYLKTGDSEGFYDGIDAAMECAYKNFPEIEAMLKKL